MSEEYEETESETPPFEDIFEAVNTIEPGGELWEWVKYLSILQRHKAFLILKEKWGIGTTEMKKDFDQHFRRSGLDEDPFWLKIYNDVSKKYGDIIKSMSDSRQLMLKRGNIYTPDIKEFIKYLSIVCEKYKTGYRNVRNDVLEKFRDSHLFDRSKFCYDPYIINFKNGYFNVKNSRFTPSIKSKKVFFYEIPHEYKEDTDDKEYTCPKFLSALQKWLGIKNKVTPKDMFQFMGYTMSMNVGQRKAFLIYGETKSGKTQFQEILKYLVGTENTSEIALQMLGDDKFSSASLEWKILNYFDDLPQKGLNDVSLFKIIAGGSSTIPIRRMHKEPYSCANTVSLWYNTNVVPMTKSTEDDSFFNRWIIVNFPNQFGEKSPDPNYEDIPYFHREITSDPDEVQGIIHYCLKALRFLWKEKHFRKELSTNSRKLWEYESDLQYAFIDKYSKPEGKWLCKSFYKWSNIHRKTRHPSRRRPAMTSTAINKDMETRGYERKRFSPSRDHHPKEYYFNDISKNKRFYKEKDSKFKEKAYKTRQEYIEEHPDFLKASNGEPEIQYEDMGELHFTDKDYNDRDKFNNKATKLIKGKKILK